MLALYLVGTCDPWGTSERTIDGICVCKNNVEGLKCTTCNEDYHVDENGNCKCKLHGIFAILGTHTTQSFA